jgi:hypothetical protein
LWYLDEVMSRRLPRVQNLVSLLDQVLCSLLYSQRVWRVVTLMAKNQLNWGVPQVWYAQPEVRRGGSGEALEVVGGEVGQGFGRLALVALEQAAPPHPHPHLLPDVLPIPTYGGSRLDASEFRINPSPANRRGARLLWQIKRGGGRRPPVRHRLRFAAERGRMRHCGTSGVVGGSSSA